MPSNLVGLLTVAGDAQIIITDDLRDQLRRIVREWDHEDESAVHDALHVNESVFASLDSARGH